jgi:hypothetical protein
LKNSLIPFIEDNVVPGSIVKMDGWNGYTSVRNKDNQHIINKIAGSGNFTFYPQCDLSFFQWTNHERQFLY